MNAKKSLFWFFIAAIIAAGVFFAFIKGTGQEVWYVKVAWMGGALLAAALGVFLRVKLGTGKRK